MKSLRTVWLIFLLAGLVWVFSGGCRTAPPCDTSLITLDETRLDVETYEQEANETGARVQELEEKLTDKKKEIAVIKDKPEELEQKVNEMKKGSGRE